MVDVLAPPHELSKLLAGEKLGHYELLEFAGGGGMGSLPCSRYHAQPRSRHQGIVAGASRRPRNVEAVPQRSSIRAAGSITITSRS